MNDNQTPFLAKEQVVQIHQDQLIQILKKDAVQEVPKSITIADIPIPCVEPNVRPSHEVEDIEKGVGLTKDGGFNCCDWITMTAISLTGIGTFYVCSSTTLINDNEYGFIINSDKLMFLKPGWHFIGYPSMSGLERHEIYSDHIKFHNVQIIRIKQDEVGIGINKANMEILLPGTHLRTSGSYIFKQRCKLNPNQVSGRAIDRQDHQLPAHILSAG